MFSLGQLLGEHHLLAVAEQVRVVRHPRNRLTVANPHVGVVFQPRVGLLQQLASDTQFAELISCPRREIGPVSLCVCLYKGTECRKSVMHGQCDVRPTVTFPASGHPSP